MSLRDVVAYYAKLFMIKNIKLIKLQDYSILRLPIIDIPEVTYTFNCTRGGT